MSTKLPRDPVSRPGEPTDAPPGSPRKIRVLTERASRREPLFHPQDNLKRRLPERQDEAPPPQEEELVEAEGELADVADMADLAG